MSTKPWPSWPIRFASGTRQSSNTSSEVSDERTPSLSSLRPDRKPGVPRSTTIAEMPFLPAARSVTVSTTAVSAMPPLVMKFFDPLISQCWPSRTAVVRMPPASEPEPGSVSPQQPTFSPFASGGRKRRFCSSLPARWMCAEHRPWWAASDSATPASTRASSSITIAQSSVPRPEPPYSSRQQAPATPSAPRRAKISRGKLLLLVPLARVRGELGLGEIAHGLAQQLLLLAQLEIHVASASGARPLPPSHGIPPSS